MRFTACLSRSLGLQGLLLAAPVSSQNATIAPTLAPSDQTNSTPAPDVNSTQQSPSPSEQVPVDASSPPSATPIVKLPCYDNTTVLREHLALKNDFTPETYELCSNTVFEIGKVSAPGELCCIDGQAPLHPRSNAKIQCGPDGSPDNMCIFVGGTFQILNSFTAFLEQPENSVFEGITFRQSLSSAALLTNGGSVTFGTVCLSNDGTIYSYHPGPALNPNTRKLMDSRAGMSLEERVNSKLLKGQESAVKVPSTLEAAALAIGNNHERELQAGIEWKLQEFTFENCLFQHNRQGDIDGDELTKYGIVTADLPYDIGTFTNCTFYNNSFGDPEDARGYAINFASGSKLSMVNNCFIDNNFIGEGAVLLAKAGDLTDSSGNYGTQDDRLKCQFIHAGTGGEYECLEYEATTCSLPVDINHSSSNAATTSSFSLLAFVVSPFPLCSIYVPVGYFYLNTRTCG